MKSRVRFFGGRPAYDSLSSIASGNNLGWRTFALMFYLNRPTFCKNYFFGFIGPSNPSKQKRSVNLSHRKKIISHQTPIGSVRCH